MSQENSTKPEQNPYEGMSRADAKEAMREAWNDERDRFLARLADIETPEELRAFCLSDNGVKVMFGSQLLRGVSFSSATLSPEYAERNGHVAGTTELFIRLEHFPQKLKNILNDEAGERVDMTTEQLADRVASAIDQSADYVAEEGNTMELSSEFRKWLVSYLTANGYNDRLTAEEKGDQIAKIAKAL